MTGLKDLMVQHEERIRNGMKAYSLLEQLRAGSTDQAVRDQFNDVKKDLGYGLLLKRYTPNVSDATEAQIQMATKDSIPRVAPLYFAFRIMVGCGIIMLLIIAASFWSVIRNRIGEKMAAAHRAVRYPTAMDCYRVRLVCSGIWPSAVGDR